MHFKQAVSTLLLSAACLSFAQADVKVGVITSSTGPIALVGLPQKNSIPLLPTQADRDEVKAEVETAQRMGITGVPCFLLEGRYALMGAQPPRALSDAITKVSEAKEKGELENPQE